jgi:hypothetical protein
LGNLKKSPFVVCFPLPSNGLYLIFFWRVLTMVYKNRDKLIFGLLPRTSSPKDENRSRCQSVVFFKLLDDNRLQKHNPPKSSNMNYLKYHTFKSNLIDVQFVLCDPTIIVMTSPLPSDWHECPLSLISSEWRRIFSSESAWNCIDWSWLDVMIHVRIRVLLLSLIELIPVSDFIELVPYSSTRFCYLKTRTWILGRRTWVEPTSSCIGQVR